VPVTERVMAERPEVRIVSRMGAGFDTVDLEAARRHGVWVANSPDYGVGEVATHALAMALALLRHLPRLDSDVRAGRWHYASTGPLVRATELTLGILGLGRIGKRMSYMSRNVFGAVIACDPYVIDGDFPAYVGRVSKEELFRKADIVSLHVPLTAETRGLVDSKLLGLMKKGSFVVNTARGAVVNVPDLLASLEDGRLEGAALDVLPQEPPAAGEPALSHPRILLTPHAAFYSVEGERELRTKAAQNLIDWARTGRPRYVVVEGK
jgi:D-3-phosphoglycerate dehydrogenase